MVCFWFVYKTIRGAASATLPQKHLPLFKTLINSLEMDLQSDDNHIKNDIHQVGNRCVDPFSKHLNTPFTITFNYLPLKLMFTLHRHNLYSCFIHITSYTSHFEVVKF